MVGSGFGGIAASLRLRAMGYEVSILEKLNQLGGRARVFKKNGYTFDAGPTVITAPFLFDELFDLFNKKRENYVKFVRLDPMYNFFSYPITSLLITTIKLRTHLKKSPNLILMM